MFLAPREALGDDLAHRPLRIHRARVDVRERVLARKPPSRLAVTMLLADEVEHVGGVTSVEHREVRTQSERRGVPAHEAVRHRVERAAEHALRRAAGRPSASACARVSISRAARRVNVSSRIRSAGTPPATSDATRAQSVVVLPVPAPASTSRWPSRCSAAARCSRFSSSSHSGVSGTSVATNIRSPNPTIASGRSCGARLSATPSARCQMPSSSAFGLGDHLPARATPLLDD